MLYLVVMTCFKLFQNKNVIYVYISYTELSSLQNSKFILVLPGIFKNTSKQNKLFKNLKIPAVFHY